MNIILATKKSRKARRFTLSRSQIYIATITFTLLVCVPLILTGYLIGRPSLKVDQYESSAPNWERQLAATYTDIEDARRSVDSHLNALALRLGHMQAQMIRLNALGHRLTEMADLDEGEFNFGELPARGGPEDPLQLGSSSAFEFLQELEQLSRELEDRERQLNVIEMLLMNRNVHNQVFPAGRPVTGGWTSSYFGNRRNPFNGRPEFHKGIDFAGKQGSDVIAVAAGVVSRSGRYAGFGNLVEIDHGSGYATRYAHNHRNLVKLGDRVSKGQSIALMGSTGRSTGTHVHFEVLRDGKTVDPIRYINAGG